MISGVQRRRRWLAAVGLRSVARSTKRSSIPMPIERQDRDLGGARATVGVARREYRLPDDEPDRVGGEVDRRVARLLREHIGVRRQIEHAPGPARAGSARVLERDGVGGSVAGRIADQRVDLEHAGLGRIGHTVDGSPRRCVVEPSPQRRARAPDGRDRRPSRRTRSARTVCRRARSPARHRSAPFPAGPTHQPGERRHRGPCRTRVAFRRGHRPVRSTGSATPEDDATGGATVGLSPVHAAASSDERRRPDRPPHHGSLSVSA